METYKVKVKSHPVVNQKYATRKEELAARRERQRGRIADKRQYHVAGENGASKYVLTAGKVSIKKKNGWFK